MVAALMLLRDKPRTISNPQTSKSRHPVPVLEETDHPKGKGRRPAHALKHKLTRAFHGSSSSNRTLCDKEPGVTSEPTDQHRMSSVSQLDTKHLMDTRQKEQRGREQMGKRKRWMTTKDRRTGTDRRGKASGSYIKISN
jgi:hypothetical protein